MIEPKDLRDIAETYESENLKFRSYLKGHVNSKELDRQFLKLHKELFKGYNCCKCTNCCHDYNICFDDTDILNASSYLNLTKEECIKTYHIENDDEDGGYIIKPPCTFLEADGKCRINPCKPTECADFPYTDKPERIWSLYGVMDFAKSCPVVFEIVKRLKEHYGFRSRIK